MQWSVTKRLASDLFILQDLPLETVSSCHHKQVGHDGAPAVKLLSKLDAHGPGVGASTGLLAINNPSVSLGCPAH